MPDLVFWSFYFNPRTPCGVRPGLQTVSAETAYFNPRTPCGVRQPRRTAAVKPSGFQSTHPVRGATSGSRPAVPIAADFNPRTPCGVRLSMQCNKLLKLAISIHAPRAGCDYISSKIIQAGRNFNPRTPCGVRLLHKIRFLCIADIFQSTHPVRGATANMYNLVCSYFCNFTKSDVCLLTLYLFYHAISTENVVFSRFSAVRSAPGIHVRSHFAPRQSISSPSGA